jgi:hypothetical protein
MEEPRLEIVYKSKLSPKEITRQRKYACKLKLPELQTVPPHNKKVAIVCSGPSVKDYLDVLRNFDGDIIAINRENKNLHDLGINFQMVVAIDPAMGMEYIGEPLKDVTYYFASNCPPKLFKGYKGYNVVLFHIFSEGVTYPEDKKHMIVGSAAGLAAIRVAKHLGYRDIHVFGMDSSWEDDNNFKTYSDKFSDPYSANHLIVECNNKKFKTSVVLLGIADDFCKYYLANTNNAKLKVYGDTFLGNLTDQLDKRYKKGKYYNPLEVA